MMSLFTLYLMFVVFPSLSCWISFLALGSGAALILSIIAIAALGPVYNDDDEQRSASFKKLCAKFLAALIIFGSLSVFLPDTKQIYTLAGAYAVTNNQDVMKLPDNIAKAANAYLEKLTAPDATQK